MTHDLMPRRGFVASCAAGLALPWPDLSSSHAAELTDSTLHYASVTTLVAAIRAKRVSSAELVDALIRRIEAVNPKINALVFPVFDQARAAAKAADRDLARRKSHGPLHGIPHSVKDSLDTAGVVTTAGTVGWAKRIPAQDATIVARLRAAGAILLGKSNTPEFTWSDETDNAVYGKTSNPYDLTRTTGGSSGGAVALVATGGVPFDTGSDTGNSIRMPAHNCGVAGLKPTHGLVPKTGHAISYRGIIQSWTQLGPIARSVDDLAYLLPIIAGVDDEDPHAAPVPLRDLNRVSIRGLRVVYFTDNGVWKPTPETIETVTLAARALGAAGARIEERVPNGLNRANELWHAIAGADGGAWLRRLLKEAGTPGEGTAGGWFRRGHGVELRSTLPVGRGAGPGAGSAPADDVNSRSDCLSGDAGAGGETRRVARRRLRRQLQRASQHHRVAGRLGSGRHFAGRTPHWSSARGPGLAGGRGPRRRAGGGASARRVAAAGPVTVPAGTGRCRCRRR